MKDVTYLAVPIYKYYLQRRNELNGSSFIYPLSSVDKKKCLHTPLTWICNEPQLKPIVQKVFRDSTDYLLNIEESLCEISEGDIQIMPFKRFFVRPLCQIQKLPNNDFLIPLEGNLYYL